MTTKIDLKKEYVDLYKASAKEVTVVKAPSIKYLMIDGKGDPNTSPDFQPNTEALYAVAYGLKFMLKKINPEQDFAIMPMEGLWWTSKTKFDAANKDKWRWTLMIALPKFVTKTHVTRVIKEVAAKKELPALKNVRLEALKEDTAVQTLHVGPYAEEGPTVEKIHAFAKENGYKLRDKHHEIYLGDPRKTAPEKLKTILRQPVTAKPKKKSKK